VSGWAVGLLCSDVCFDDVQLGEHGEGHVIKIAVLLVYLLQGR